MSTPTTKSPEPLVTPGDELAAAGDWNDFGSEQLLTENGAIEIITSGELLQQRIEEAGMDQGIALGFATQPFRWKDKVFRILKAAYVGGKAVVEVSPPDAEFEADVRRRIEQDRFHTLTFYQGFGFVCFPEDYAKYQG